MLAQSVSYFHQIFLISSSTINYFLSDNRKQQVIINILDRSQQVAEGPVLDRRIRGGARKNQVCSCCHHQLFKACCKYLGIKAATRNPRKEQIRKAVLATKRVRRTMNNLMSLEIEAKLSISGIQLFDDVSEDGTTVWSRYHLETKQYPGVMKGPESARSCYIRLHRFTK